MICSAAFAQDSSVDQKPPELQGALDVFDVPGAPSRMVLYEAGAGKLSVAQRAQLESGATAAGKTVTWVLILKEQIEEKLQQLPSQSPTLNGAVVNGVAFKFSDAENVDVILDLTLKHQHQEQLLMSAANDLLSGFAVKQKVVLNARPGKVAIIRPEVPAVLAAINADLANPELRLSGCKVSSIVFTQEADVCSTLVEGTVAFEFQSDAVIESVKSSLEKLGWEDWTAVKPEDAGFNIQLPDMTPFIEDLRQTLRDEESTALKVILLDAFLQSDENAPGQMLVILEGHTSTSETIESVVDVANGVATRFFAPYLTQEASEHKINVRPDNLALKVTSRYSSKHLVRLSHSYAQQNRLEDARNTLELAAFEDKRALETMYWLAVTQLKANDIEGARKSLRIAVRENGKLIEESQRGNRNRYSEMLHTLEPVQGTLRQKLHELEGKVYADYNKVKRGIHLTRVR